MSDSAAEARRALLEQRRKGRAAAPQAQPIAPRPADAPAPASFGQERLWFVQQAQPDSAAYTMTNATCLRGALDTAALRGALQAVVDRHEALRTTLALEGGALVQRIAPSLALDLTEHDVAPGQAEARLRELARQPFDLERGPLFRAALLRETPDTHILALLMHHIIADEWSVGVIWRDMAAAYAALAAGQPYAAAPLAIQYADVAWHQREQLARGAYEAQLRHWEAQLAGDLAPLQLPTDRPRPPVQRYEGGFITSQLAPDISERLLAIGRAAGATPFATLLAAFQLLLHRLSGQPDILVGAPVTSRDRAETEDLVGFFLNTVVLRADFSRPQTFAELLAEARRQSLAALANQALPFDRLVERLAPRRDASHHPIFQAMFVLQEGARGSELPGLTAEPVTLDAGIAKFDVTLFAAVEGEQVRLALEYSSALFEEAAARRMLRCYETLLASIAERPDAPVERLAILPPEERRLLLEEWAPPDTAPQDDRRIHDLIAAQPADRTAVLWGDEALSYGELRARAGHMANYLRAIGVPAGAPVGLCVERSPDMIVGILTVLMAGCAYVPIDPAYPAERIAYLLDDAGIDVLLTQPQLVDRLPEHSARLVTFDDPALAGYPDAEPEPRAGPDDLAYMIYTSGSTGQPKGVRVSHRNLVHSTSVRFTYFPEPVGCFMLLSSFAFDSSVAGIFWALCQGGALCLPPQHAERDVLALAELVRRHRVTHTLMLPSLYRVLLEFAGAETLRSLRAVMVAGEACPVSLAAQHHATLPHAALYNEYGPTEGTVWCTAWRIPPHPERILIGRAIPNTQVYILDAARQPVPVGVAGELYVGGRGVAQGYHRRPELTAERFVENPFGPGRLYRTGDLARFLASGEIEFLGRMDDQVKLSGYRVELGEVEALLARHPAVTEAVALIEDADDAPGDEELLRLLAAHPDAARLLDEVEALADDEAERR